MEKQTSCTSAKRHNRLLRFFCACVLLPISALLAAQNISFTQAASFTVAEDSKFLIEMPGISPSSVEIIHKDLPSSVSFVSSMKSDTFIMDKDGNRERGTLISYTVHFLEPGMYNLNSLDILIDSISYVIDFPPVNVSQNPDILLPELYLDPHGSLYQSQKGVLVLSGRYFKRIENLEWNLSENALIEKSLSEIPVPSDNFPFSEEKTTIAIFSYTPLASGTLILPQITANFVAYNGHSYTVQPKIKTATVLPPISVPASSELRAQDDLPQVGTYAQANNSSQSILSMQADNTAFVEKLAKLRSQERHALFPFMAKKERIALEETANLQNVGETSELWAIIFVILGVLLLLFGFILYKKQKAKQTDRKSHIPIACFSIATVLVFLAIFSTFKLSRQYALTLPSQLRTIPEYEASNITTLFAGMRVRIFRTAGDWYLVSLEDTRSGWILKDDCILID